MNRWLSHRECQNRTKIMPLVESMLEGHRDSRVLINAIGAFGIMQNFARTPLEVNADQGIVKKPNNTYPMQWAISYLDDEGNLKYYDGLFHSNLEPILEASNKNDSDTEKRRKRARNKELIAETRDLPKLKEPYPYNLDPSQEALDLYDYIVKKEGLWSYVNASGSGPIAALEFHGSALGGESGYWVDLVVRTNFKNRINTIKDKNMPVAKALNMFAVGSLYRAQQAQQAIKV